ARASARTRSRRGAGDRDRNRNEDRFPIGELNMDGSNQWYMAIGGHQVGPVSQQEIITNLQNGSIDAETLVFSAGMTQWQKVKDVAAFAPFVKGSAGASAGQAAFAPGGFTPPPAPGRR